MRHFCMRSDKPPSRSYQLKHYSRFEDYRLPAEGIEEAVRKYYFSDQNYSKRNEYAYTLYVAVSSHGKITLKCM